jgi:hypothetical protein
VSWESLLQVSACALALAVLAVALAVVRVAQELRGLRRTLDRKAASEALFRREQTYGALRDREHKGDGRG